MRPFITSAFALLLAWCSFSRSGAALAHEYYLQPENFSPPLGTEFYVSHKLGQKFKGNGMPWIDRWNVRSELWQGKEHRELRSRDGDRPALRLSLSQERLATVVHESNIDKLDFKVWEKFVSYTDKEGLSAIARQHLSEGNPKPDDNNPIRELYARFAKTLVTPNGTTQGDDVATGLTIELVALENPMRIKAGAGLPVQLLFRREPLEGATVKVFAAPGQEHSRRLITDAQGRVLVPDDGPGPYLLNAIAMTKVVATGDVAEGADWQSFWASLTFERRGR